LAEWLIAVEQSNIYGVVLLYFATYPIVTSIMWTTTALIYRSRWEPDQESPPSRTQPWPFVSVLVPAHNEQAVIARSVRAMLQMDYPDFEVIVIDDGSKDRTLEMLAPWAQDPKLRIIHKAQNEGKAMALNDAIPLARGEILMCLDADAEPEPDMLRWVVPHFDSPRVAAVTGNPRVKNTDTFLARLQAIEFSSVISLLRRAQRVWGRIATVSGVVAAIRRSAVWEVGGFSPEMPTEDIELTWKLQKRFYDVRYEPQAICWMTVPRSLKALFRQRLRWARGLMQVLHKHRDVITQWRTRRMWPVFVESALSILWAICFVGLTVLWILSLIYQVPPMGASPYPNLWGMAVATVCMCQLIVGGLIDRRYDPGLVRYLPYAVWYPLVYWALLAVATVVALPHLFRRPGKESIRWETPREGIDS
jgi:biofilm PGA synthesis N-glycosyltransferase PgaC